MGFNFQAICGNIKRAIKIKNFWLKVFGMILNIVTYRLWRPWGGGIGMLGLWQNIIFIYTVPPSNVIFTAEIVIMLLGDRPGRWFYRVYNSVGSILYGIVAVVSLYNRYRYPLMGTIPLIISIICQIQSFVLIVDMLMNERFVVASRWHPGGVDKAKPSRR